MRYRATANRVCTLSGLESRLKRIIRERYSAEQLSVYSERTVTDLKMPCTKEGKSARNKRETLYRVCVTVLGRAATMYGSDTAWFQVICPSCTAALQTRLPVGVTPVECSQCKTVFAVQIHAAVMKDVVMQSPSKVKRTRKASLRAAAERDLEEQRRNGPPPVTLAYRLFLSQEMRHLYKEHPGMSHTDVMRKAASNWAASPMNPKNAPTLSDAADARPIDSAGPSGVGGGRSNDAVDADNSDAEYEDAMEDAGENDGEREEPPIEVVVQAEDGQTSRWQWLTRLGRWLCVHSFNSLHFTMCYL